MDLGSALSLGTMLSAAVTALKDAKELATDVEHVDLKEKIGAAYDTLLELKIRLYEYDEENRQLRQELESKTAYVGPLPPHSYVYQADDTERQSPLCPRCFQHQPRIISYLSGPQITGSRRVLRKCNLCPWVATERPGQQGDPKEKQYWE
jgi:hypothetical protein